MQQTFFSMEDNILHYIYFNAHCPLKELEKQVLHSPLIKKSNITYSLLKLEKENLIYKESGNITITEEGKIAVENHHSYDDYIAFKNAK